jgi:alkanesulfonate monooxygenase SsuD/methylene tetrahydromethanopterin reductase-like flavin-dependent oxidoreductase (luciferase family)
MAASRSTWCPAGSRTSPPTSASRLEHGERYRRSAEFLQVLRKIWAEDDVDFRGDFYRIHDFTLKPKPLVTAERPNPEIHLVQYNDGFRTQLIGTPEQIAERVAAYRKRGVDLILGGFLHFQEEIEYFSSRVLPLVREIEDSEEDSVGEPILASV